MKDSDEEDDNDDEEDIGKDANKEKK